MILFNPETYVCQFFSSFHIWTSKTFQLSFKFQFCTLHFQSYLVFLSCYFFHSWIFSFIWVAISEYQIWWPYQLLQLIIYYRSHFILWLIVNLQCPIFPQALLANDSPIMWSCNPSSVASLALFFSHKPLHCAYVAEPQWMCHGLTPNASIFPPSLLFHSLVFIFCRFLPHALLTSTRRPPSPTISCSPFPFPSLVKMQKRRRGGRPSVVLRGSGSGHVFVLSS